MARATFAVFLTVDCADPSDAGDAIDNLLDAGFFQDAINENLPDGRVKCCVIRSVSAEVVTAHDAHPDEAQ